MKLFVYVLHSQSLRRFYVGHTDNVAEHNRGKSTYTSKGVPWELITTFERNSRSDAMKLEREIKKEASNVTFKTLDF